MAKQKKFYVVWKGIKPGIYENWDDCKAQIFGFNEAQYKSFESEKEAQEAFAGKAEKYIYGKKNKTTTSSFSQTDKGPILNSISVDAACNMKIGRMEYRGVYTQSKMVLFSKGPFEEATNNIGEFLAIVHALAYCKQKNISLPIYSDSMTALAWIKKKKANTKQEATELNQEIFDLLDRAEKWLRENTFKNTLLKWDTKKWGEIPADYDRK